MKKITRMIKNNFNPLRSIKERKKSEQNAKRRLPELIIIGAQKSGTTSLYSYMDQHPQLVGASRQEVHYFDGGLDPSVDNFEKGELWYRSHFPLQSELGPEIKAFEASPLYIFHPLVPKRIHDNLPEAKLIALLRNPVERAISHYFHEQRKGRESLPILEALKAEEQRLAPVLELADYKNTTFKNYSYKSSGIYHEQLKRYLEYFAKENLLVLNSEKLFEEPKQTLKRVYEFAGVDPDYLADDLSPRNTGSNRTKVDPDVYAYLQDFFEPHNQALYKLIGEEFDWS